MPNTASEQSTIPTFLKSGSDYFRNLLALIQNAESEILLQTYILKEDQTGISVVDALIDSASRGVSVYLMLDAYGSGDLSENFLRKMKDSGIHFRWFGRFFTRKLSLGRRLHHKIVVVDGTKLILGGINIADRYNNTITTAAWLDVAILMEDNVASHARTKCLELWHRRYTSDSIPTDNENVTLIINDFLRGQNQISNAIEKAINKAKDEILILGAYYLPTSALRYALQKATDRGVKIKVILSKFSDVALFKNAANYLYDWMFRHHFEIYEYQTAVVHGKVIVIDKNWVTLGSYNLNYLSSYLSVEMNAELKNPLLGAEIYTYLNSIIKNECNQIKKQEMKFNIFNRFIHWCSFQIIRITLQADYAISRRK